MMIFAIFDGTSTEIEQENAGFSSKCVHIKGHARKHIYTCNGPLTLVPLLQPLLITGPGVRRASRVGVDGRVEAPPLCHLVDA